MRAFRSIVILLALSATSLPTSASPQAFEAINRLKVFGIGGTDFEVIEARGEGARGMWCAAADYAKARYGQGFHQRIYVKVPRGPSQTVAGRKGVVFTIDAASLSQPPSSSVSVTTSFVGVSLPANHAIQFCKDYLLDLEDILLRRGY